MRGPALDDVATRLTRDQLIRQVLQGGGNMPAYGKNLRPAEVTALVAFLETLHPPGQLAARDASARRVALGADPEARTARRGEPPLDRVERRACARASRSASRRSSTSAAGAVCGRAARSRRRLAPRRVPRRARYALRRARVAARRLRRSLPRRPHGAAPRAARRGAAAARCSARPLVPLLRGLPGGPRARRRRRPALAGSAIGSAIRSSAGSRCRSRSWGWHVPAAYELALRVAGAWHVVEHASFFGAGLLFWWPVVQPVALAAALAALDDDPLPAARRPAEHGARRVARVLGSRALSELRGVARRAARRSGRSPGVLMWVPMSLAYLVPARC